MAEIWRSIAADDPTAADRQIDRIERSVGRLADFPSLGHVRDDVAPSLRALLCDNYLVIYRYFSEEQTVVLERIIHGRRKLSDLFRN